MIELIKLKIELVRKRFGIYGFFNISTLLIVILSIVCGVKYILYNGHIMMYINSPGGVITAGMAIYDTMNHIRADVCTICLGEAASMGSFLLSAGAKGKRMALPSARIMIHQPLGGAQGQATDIEIEAKEILRMKKELNTLLAQHTGQTVEQIYKDTERDNYMSAQEAMEYGLIDKVL